MKRHKPGSVYLTAVILCFLLVPSASFATRDQGTDGVEVEGGLGGDVGGVDGVAGTRGRGSGGFGDNVGAGFDVPDFVDRDISALFGSMFNPQTGVVTDKDFKDRRDGIDEVYSQQDAAAAAMKAQYEAYDAAAAKEIKEREDRIAQLKWESLVAARKRALDSLNRFEEVAEADGVWTSEEAEEYDRRNNLLIQLEQPTAEELAEMDRQTRVRHGVADHIRQIANRLGGTSAADREARRQRHATGDAGTMTWRNLTFTGQMVNQVGNDIFRQREIGIAAKNRYVATQIYLKQDGLTEEQIKVAEEMRDRAYQQMGDAADAISKDTAVILLGSAADVGLMGLGRPISFFGGKVSGFFGKGPKAAPAAGTTGTQVGGQAGREAGQVGPQVGKTAGTDAAAAQRAANQAAADAASDAAIAGKKMPPPQKFQDVVGHTVMLEGGAARGGSSLTQAAAEAAEQAWKLTDDQIAQLFKPGVNLTERQLLQKIALMKSGNAPANASNPETVNAIRQALMEAFPNYRLQVLNEFLSGGESAVTGMSSGGTLIDDAVRGAQSAVDPGISQGGTVMERAAGSAASSGRVGAPTASQIDSAKKVHQSLETIANEPM